MAEKSQDFFEDTDGINMDIKNNSCIRDIGECLPDI